MYIGISISVSHFWGSFVFLEITKLDCTCIFVYSVTTYMYVYVYSLTTFVYSVTTFVHVYSVTIFVYSIMPFVLSVPKYMYIQRNIFIFSDNIYTCTYNVFSVNIYIFSNNICTIISETTFVHSETTFIHLVTTFCIFSNSICTFSNSIYTVYSVTTHFSQEEDKKMRSYAVIPPMMLDARQRKLRYTNNNGRVEDPMDEDEERKFINVWTPQEKNIFKEKYLQHPKNFSYIAQFLERKVILVAMYFE